MLDTVMFRASTPILVFFLVAVTPGQNLLYHWEAGASGAVMADHAGKMPARLVPDAGTALALPGGGHAVVLDGKRHAVVADDHTEMKLPKRELSIAAWVRVDAYQDWGGAFSCIQDNGAAETGFLLGSRKDRFCFALSTRGVGDADGLLTYLSATKPFTRGRWHHVCGTYNGKAMRIWMDGDLVGESTVQSGNVFYPDKTRVILGGYHDSNEHYPGRGALHAVKLWRSALSKSRVRREWSSQMDAFPEPVRIEDPPVKADQVAAAVDRGVRWLLSMQQPDGSWAGLERDYYVGQTALCVYTLVKSGLDPKHPSLRLGLEYLRSMEYTQTYDLGIVLMALAAMKGEAQEDEIKALAQRVVSICGNGSSRRPARWGYPFGFSDGVGNGNVGYEDISNTQYALLGLRAARKAGVKVGGATFWARVAKALVADQAAYGGFGYRHGSTTHTSSLTAAGVCSLIIVRDVLDEMPRLPAGLRGRVRASVTNGVMWFKNHWSVTENVGGSSSWYYYYMYGLERIGSYLGQDRLGGHAWHTEGAREIIRRQRKDGSFGDGDMDTCFALLFLRRGSRSSGLGPRSRASIAIPDDARLVIGSAGEQPLVAYVRRVGARTREILDGGKATFRWEVDGAVVETLTPKNAEAVFAPSANLKRALDRNGKYVLRALIEAPGSKPVVSLPLEVWIDSVEEDWHREALRDYAAGNLVRQRAGVMAQASSENPGGRWSSHRAAMAVDGRYATSWWCAKGEKEPWLRVDLPGRVRAKVLKLAPARDLGKLAGKVHDRPKEIELALDRTRPFRITLPDEPYRKHVIRLPGKAVRSIRITVRSRYPGSSSSRYVGFQEVELFRQLDPEDEGRALGPR